MIEEKCLMGWRLYTMKHPFGGKGSKKNNTELCLVNKNKKNNHFRCPLFD